jgi:hypothetical protein
MSTKEEEGWPNAELQDLKGSLTHLLAAPRAPVHRRRRPQKRQDLSKDEAIEAAKDYLLVVL